MSISPEQNQPTRPAHERVETPHADHELPSLEATASVPYQHADDEAPTLTRIEQVTDQKKGFWTVKRAIGAGVTAVVVAGAAALGAGTLSGSHSGATKTPRPTASAPATPGASSTPESTPSAASTEKPGDFPQPTPLEVSAYKTPEELAKAWNSEMMQWENAGGTLANANAWSSSSEGTGYIDQVVAPIDAAYTKALVTKYVGTEPGFVQWLNDWKQGHRTTVLANLSTQPTTIGHDPGDKEPYVVTTEVTNTTVISNTPEQIVMSITDVGQDNSSQNHAGSIFAQPFNTAPQTSTVTFVNEGGEWKLAAITDYNPVPKASPSTN